MKLLILKFRAVILVIGLLTFGALSWLRPKVSSTPCNPKSMSAYSATGWTNDPIDGDDTAFKEIRQKIDALKAKGDDMVAWTNTYKQAAQKVPEDAQAQFRWGYAAFLSSHYERYATTKPQILCGVYAAMGQPKNPKTFEYARLRFLVGSISLYDGSMAMEQLGIRLLQRAPKDDFDLRYMGINALGYKANFNNPQPLEKGLKLTLDLQKDFPKRIEPDYMLAGTYASQFAITKKASLANKSLLYYRQYLQIAPQDYTEWRDWAQRSIQMVEDIRTNYQQREELKP